MNDPDASRRHFPGRNAARSCRFHTSYLYTAALFALLTMIECRTGFASPYVQVRTEETQIIYQGDGQCGHDLPDHPARALRSVDGLLQVIIGNDQKNFRLTGSSFDDLKPDCTTIIESGRNADPAAYDDAEWLLSAYVVPDGRIAALIHSEYHPWEHSERGAVCDAAADLNKKSSWQEKRPAILSCWYNAITFASSTNNGASYTSPRAPANFVAGLPYRYEPDMGKTGMFSPSNIVLNDKDNYYYFLAFGQSRISGTRVCALRTRDLFDPSSWRAWDGRDFSMKMVDPYVTNIDDPTKHECAPLQQTRFDGKTGRLMVTVQGLTYNTFYKRWMIVYNDASDRAPNGPGIYFALSDNLVKWSQPYLIMPFYVGSDGRKSIVYPSIIDQNDDSANFENTDQHSWLYYVKFAPVVDQTRFGKHSGTPPKRRAIFRVPIEFMPLAN